MLFLFPLNTAVHRDEGNGEPFTLHTHCANVVCRECVVGKCLGTHQGKRLPFAYQQCVYINGVYMCVYICTYVYLGSTLLDTTGLLHLISMLPPSSQVLVFLNCVPHCSGAEHKIVKMILISFFNSDRTFSRAVF